MRTVPHLAGISLASTLSGWESWEACYGGNAMKL